MTPRLLVAYATKKGSVAEVAEFIGDTLRDRGLDVDVQPASAVKSVDGYDRVVLGGALYMGRWHADAKAFLKRHHEALATVPLAVFAMGPLTLEEKDVAGARTQLDRALRGQPDLAPVSVAVFGGVVDPAKLRFPFNRMPATDTRDWDRIREWALEVETKAGDVAGVA
jgi:menaquinone-dependent protoporphyrinogen oxidase